MLFKSIAWSVFVGAAFYTWLFWFSAEAKKPPPERRFLRHTLCILIIPGIIAAFLLPFHFYNNVSFSDIAIGNMQWNQARRCLHIAYSALTTVALGLVHLFIAFLFRR
jgi:hypothetical protein